MSNYSQRSIILRIHENIETSWRKKYEQYLDFNGREPRPIDERSLAALRVDLATPWDRLAPELSVGWQAEWP